MERKICYTCNSLKLFSEFGIDRSRKDGLNYQCKKCKAIAGKRHYKDSLGRYKKRHLKWAKDNPDKAKKASEKYRIKNHDRLKKRTAEWIKRNPEKAKEATKKWRQKNRGYSKKWRQKNKEKLNAQEREKRENDPSLRLYYNTSWLIRKSLKNNKNGKKWEGLVGYTQEDLREHLEAQFREGMTWENYGKNGWHIDHIIPISIFNITSAKSKGFKKCWALENLQPLWEGDNIRKSNKLFYHD